MLDEKHGMPLLMFDAMPMLFCSSPPVVTCDAFFIYDFDQSGCAFVLNNERCPDRSVNSQISIKKLGESHKRNLMIDLDLELRTCALSTYILRELVI